MRRAGLAGVMLTLALSGCTTFGLERSTISFSRDETLLFYADLKADVREAIVLLDAVCTAKAIPADKCARLEQLRERAKAADALFQAGVRERREFSLQDLRGLMDAAAALGRLAGYPIPTLPR